MKIKVEIKMKENFFEDNIRLKIIYVFYTFAAHENTRLTV